MSKYIYGLMQVLVLVLLSGLSACMGTGVENKTRQKEPLGILKHYNNQSEFCAKVTSQKLTDCSAKGGKFLKQGRAQCYVCTIHYSDAGKTCTSSGDCMGGCFKYGKSVPTNSPNQTGVCAKNNVKFGCFQRIENGKAENSMLCVD